MSEINSTRLQEPVVKLLAFRVQCTFANYMDSQGEAGYALSLGLL